MSVFADYQINGNSIIAKDTGAEIPLTSQFLKDVVRVSSFLCFVNALKATRAVRGQEPLATISFYPKRPRPYYAIWPVCQMANVKIVDDPQDADLHFYFEDNECSLRHHAAPTDRPVLNEFCTDIRKSIVARNFEDVFGYGLSVDPTRYQGLAVEKSEANGKHDGRIVNCPMKAPRTDRVYQRLIDNTYDGKEYIDLRTPIVGEQIPFVYLKRRSPDGRFSNDNDRVDLADVDAVLSKDEQTKIIAFAKRMALDFGGLDVLRNRADGRIYIVDVNKTDMGPPTVLSGKDKVTAIRGLSDAFVALVRHKIADHGVMTIRAA